MWVGGASASLSNERSNCENAVPRPGLRVIRLTQPRHLLTGHAGQRRHIRRTRECRDQRASIFRVLDIQGQAERIFWPRLVALAREIRMLGC